MNQYIEKIIITQKQIEDKCEELALWVNKKYKDSEELLILGILKGSVVFLSQLIKNIKVINKIEFMMVSSYQETNKSLGKLKKIMDLQVDIKNKDVLVVEDIVDTGFTLSRIVKNLKNQKPKSLKTIAMLDKKDARSVEFFVDKRGFDVPNKYLVGYGLDIKGKLRSLPYVAIFNSNMLNKI